MKNKMISQIPQKIDSTIDRLFNIDHDHMSHHDSVRYIYASLLNLVASRAMAENLQRAKLLCISFSAPEEMHQVISEIDAMGMQNGKATAFELLSGGNLLQSADTMMQLGECDAVVLFEKKDQAKVSTIQNGLSVLERMNKKVLGLVLME